MLVAIRRAKLRVKLTLTVLTCFLIQPPGDALAASVTVPAGTVVMCKFEEPITPATTTVGRRLTLRVIQAVQINGVTVIEANAPVIAEVTQAQKVGSVGKPALIGVALRSVATVDGQTVALTGQYAVEGENKQTTSLVVTILCCVLGLLMKGGDAVIPEGTHVDGSTIATVTVMTP